MAFSLKDRRASFSHLLKKASCLVTFPCEIQRAEEISLEALDYGAGQTLAKLEIKPVDSSFEQYEKQVNTLVAAMSRKEIKRLFFPVPSH